MEKNTVRVWDIAVRLFHWSLVACFVISYLTGDEETQIHIYSGYTIIGLVLFRIFWGFVGSRHARFTDFVRGPSAVVGYLKGIANANPKHYRGHTPAGGWMIMALLASLLLTTYSGLQTYGAEGYGPLANGAVQMEIIAPAYADDDEYEHDEYGEEEDEFWEEIHEFFANFTLLLVIVHVLAVLATSYLHGENLAWAMVTGRKARR